MGGGGGGEGVHVNLTKKLRQRSLSVVFAFFLVPSLFYRYQMVNFKEKYFSRFRRGSNFSRGGPTFIQGGGGGQLLIPFRNPYNL